MLRQVLKNILVHHKPSKVYTKHFQTTPILTEFWEPDDKGGYVSKLPRKTQSIREAFKDLKHEIALWTEEVKEHLASDPLLIYRPGETDVVWKFGTPESLDPWLVGSDKDHNEGYSTCSLALTKDGKGLFSGQLDVRVPKDGRIKRAGYCNIKTMRKKKSFYRDAYFDWTSYNTIVIKVRGDGRSYMFNIHCKGFFDLQWNDVYHYPLYTRGGPYWQLTKIPFSKFFFASKGRIQDIQCAIALQRVTGVSITMADKVNGKFALEVDYIGLEYDPNHTEEFAYEMYKTASPNIAAH